MAQNQLFEALVSLDTQDTLLLMSVCLLGLRTRIPARSATKTSSSQASTEVGCPKTADALCALQATFI